MNIETERLILREFTLNDLDAFASLISDSEVMRFSLRGPMKEITQIKEHFQKRILGHYIQYGHGFYAAFLKEGGCFIGGIGLMTQNIEGESKIELGYRLHQKYWGQGFATEACIAVCHYAFTELEIEELISLIDPQNTRSINVAKRIRMKFLRNTFFHHLPVQMYMINAQRT